MIRAACLAGTLLVAGLSGCGGGTADIEVVPPLAGGPEGVQAQRARALFTENCSSCHTLADADAHGTAGPNLDDLRPDGRRVARKVQAGGGGMPSFSGRLARAEIVQLAGYVDAVTDR
jgi:mono/diheme cytochrome c family protein